MTRVSNGPPSLPDTAIFKSYLPDSKLWNYQLIAESDGMILVEALATTAPDSLALLQLKIFRLAEMMYVDSCETLYKELHNAEYSN